MKGLSGEPEGLGDGRLREPEGLREATRCRVEEWVRVESKSRIRCVGMAGGGEGGGGGGGKGGMDLWRRDWKGEGGEKWVWRRKGRAGEGWEEMTEMAE